MLNQVSFCWRNFSVRDNFETQWTEYDSLTEMLPLHVHHPILSALAINWASAKSKTQTRTEKEKNKIPEQQQQQQ